MSALNSVIRLHQWQLDERRQQLAELERLQDKIKGEASRLAAELVAEQRVAANSQEASFGYGAYAQALIERRQKLDGSLAELEGQIQRARDALAEAFQDVKRYEIAQATRARRSRAAVQRKERIQQDELGLEMHRRRSRG